MYVEWWPKPLLEGEDFHQSFFLLPHKQSFLPFSQLKEVTIQGFNQGNNDEPLSFLLFLKIYARFIEIYDANPCGYTSLCEYGGDFSQKWPNP